MPMRIDVNRHTWRNFTHRSWMKVGWVPFYDCWIEIEQIGPHEYEIVADNIATDHLSLAVYAWTDAVEDLDRGSDASSCFGLSLSVRWKDVDIRPSSIHAPSLEQLKLALNQVLLCGWDPREV